MKNHTTVLSRIEFARTMNIYIENHISLDDKAIIEIEDKDVPFYFNEDKDNIIRLRFDDAESNEPNCMSEEQAVLLINFINANIGKDFIIHCAAGQSRSAAVQRFILDCYDDYEATISKPFANWHVVTLLKRIYLYNDIR